MVFDFYSLRSDIHTDFARGLSWSPLDDSLLSSGWDKAVLTHMCGLKSSSDLVVEFSKSRNESVISVDSEPPLQPQVNGEVKNNEEEEDNMDVAEAGDPFANGEKSCGAKIEEIEVESWYLQQSHRQRSIYKYLSQQSNADF